MSMQGAILAQVRESVENLVAVATGELEKKVAELEARVAKLEKASAPSAAKAAPSTRAQAGTAKATGKANP